MASSKKKRLAWFVFAGVHVAREPDRSGRPGPPPSLYHVVERKGRWVATRVKDDHFLGSRPTWQAAQADCLKDYRSREEG